MVSVLFADLVGFTSRSERLDVDEVEAFLAPYQALLRREVERTGGLVAKSTGDGVMALFGADAAHEDDPERAVRCGLGISQRLVDERAETESVPPLRVRVGVTTGEALVSRDTLGNLDAVGDVVNTAARLESAAPADGVLVDEWTYRATDRVIRYESAAAVDAKGKSEPVAVWRAFEPRSIVPEQARESGLPLVGREVEVATVRAALDRARGEPSTQLVTLVGEPGIGKSRLVDELFAYIEELPELITWRRGRSLAYGEGVAFWALGEMVKAQAGVLESDDAQLAEAKLSEAVAAVVLDEGDRAWVARQLRPLVGLESEASSSGEGGRVEAFAAWRRFFEALAEDGPTVLVFEDIHWADDGLLDFVDLLADRAGAVPLLIVCTARPEILQRREGWAGGKINAQTINLTPLSEEDTARLVRSLLDQVLLPAPVQQGLLERAEGNPLYAQEFVRMLQDRGVLVRGDSVWRMTGEITDLPESIQGIIAARLDTLTDSERRFLQGAAVVGKTAWIGAVCALIDESAWQGDELLHSLERKQLLRRVRSSSVSGETEFSFTHALTKDVAYSQIRRHDRAHYHEAAAEWIDQLAGTRDDKAELLAEHYTQALHLRDQLGEDTATLAVRARRAYTEAGRQSASVFAHLAAARHYRAALDLTPDDDTEQRAVLLFGEATAQFAVNAADDRILGAAADAQVAAEAWEAAAMIERLRSVWYEEREAAGDKSRDHLELAATYAARVPPGEAMCRIASDRAFNLIVSGHAREALDLVDRALAVAQPAGLEVGCALLLTWQGNARVMLGDVDGITDMQWAADTLAKHAHPSTPNAYGNLASVLRGLGDMPAVDHALSVAGQWAERTASNWHIDWVKGEQAVQAYHAADWDAARRHFKRIDTTKGGYNEIQIGFTQGRLSLAAGDYEAARTDAAIVVFANSTHNNETFFNGAALTARCQNFQGRTAEALSECNRFLDRWQEFEPMMSSAVDLAEVAPILAAAERHPAIREAALLLPEACRWRDALLAIADQRYADAATLYEQIGSQPLAADAHILAAAQARSQGRTADAHRHAEAVIEFAKRTGAVAYQQRAEALLAATA